MKKLLAIICILLVIFIGMYVYKINLNKKNINISEVQKIEEYISKIYMWQEVTKEALPQFNEINEAPDLWIWEVVKKNLDEYELTEQEIQEKATEIFGEKFQKKFPKEGNEFIIYDETINKYVTTGIELDELEDSFYIKQIKKTHSGYQVEIVEYLEDYGEAIKNQNENQDYDIYIKKTNNEIVSTIKSTEGETRAIEVVKENIDNFNKKTINLIKNRNGNIFVENVIEETMYK